MTIEEELKHLREENRHQREQLEQRDALIGQQQAVIAEQQAVIQQMQAQMKGLSEQVKSLQDRFSKDSHTSHPPRIGLGERQKACAKKARSDREDSQDIGDRVCRSRRRQMR